MLAAVIAVLDISIVNVALPSIKDALHFSSTDLQWVVNAYTLVFAGFLLLGGRAADLLGRRAVLIGGLLLGLLMVAVGSTAFDGAKEGALFNDIAQGLQDFFRDLGLGIGLSLELAFVIGLAGAVAIIAAIYTLGMRGMRPPEGTSRRELSRAFAHTLIPIAAAYVVAHYFSLLVFRGQSAWALASDPLGKGSDLFGTAGREIDYGVVSTTAIWYVQVGADGLRTAGGSSPAATTPSPCCGTRRRPGPRSRGRSRSPRPPRTSCGRPSPIQTRSRPTPRWPTWPPRRTRP